MRYKIALLKTDEMYSASVPGLRGCWSQGAIEQEALETFLPLCVGRGIGIACSSYISGAGLPIYWNSMPHSGVQLRLDRQGGVCVQCGSTDIGQGSDSILAYIVAEVLGIDPFDIRVVTADTDLTPVDLGSYSSRVTLMTKARVDSSDQRSPSAPVFRSSVYTTNSSLPGAHSHRSRKFPLTV
mgnify:CR=1 FL=1